MLGYTLAVLVGTSSVGLYLAAFVLPEVHRKYDFVWSGVGLFYALALWIYARQTTGGILVGQTASVALLGWSLWQTITLRRQLVPTSQQTSIPTKNQVQQQLGLKPKSAKPTKTKSNPAPIVAPPIKEDPPIIREQPSVIIPPAIPEEEEAWIKLEVKRSPVPAKPIEPIVKPSQPPQPPQLPAIAAESVPRNVPIDPNQ